MIAELARLPFARLVRTPRAWIPIAGWTLLALAAAWVARSSGREHAATQAFDGMYATIALPLLVFGVVAATLGGESLSRSASPLVSFGAQPARASLVTAVVAILAGAVAGGILAAIVAIVAHGPADPPLGFDAAMSAWYGALGGAAYGAYFVLGSTFGKRGGGRSIFLLIDFVFGGTTIFGMLTPRGHVRNLLAVEGPMGIAPRWSLVALIVLVLLCGGLSIARARR